MDLELTQFGKRLLARGQFKPAHYAFFDDDILYDNLYGSPRLRASHSNGLRVTTAVTETNFSITVPMTINGTGKAITIFLKSSYFWYGKINGDLGLQHENQSWPGENEIWVKVQLTPNTTTDRVADAINGVVSMIQDDIGYKPKTWAPAFGTVYHIYDGPDLAGAIKYGPGILGVPGVSAVDRAFTGGQAYHTLRADEGGYAGNDIVIAASSDGGGAAAMVVVGDGTPLSGGTNHPVISPEQQNSASVRIIEETPRMKCQYNWGAASKIDQQHEIIAIGMSGHLSLHFITAEAQHPNERMYYLKMPIGSCDANSQMAPSWDLKFLDGQYKTDSLVLNVSASSNFVGNVFGDLAIPQLSSSIKIKTKVSNDGFPSEEEEKDLLTTHDLGGGVSLHVLNDSIFIRLGEKNVPYDRDNFSIEVYEIKEKFNSAVSGDFLSQKAFFDDPTEEKPAGNILTDTPAVPTANVEFDDSYVNYYLDIKMDNEIDEETLCSITDKTKSIFMDPFGECDDKEPANVNIYGELDDEDIGDVCE